MPSEFQLGELDDSWMLAECLQQMFTKNSNKKRRLSLSARTRDKSQTQAADTKCTSNTHCRSAGLIFSVALRTNSMISDRLISLSPRRLLINSSDPRIQTASFSFERHRLSCVQIVYP